MTRKMALTGIKAPQPKQKPKPKAALPSYRRGHPVTPAAPFGTSWQRLIDSDLRRRVNDARIAWEAAHGKKAAKVLLGASECSELGIILDEIGVDRQLMNGLFNIAGLQIVPMMAQTLLQIEGK